MKGYKLDITGVPRQSRLPFLHPLNASQLTLGEDEIASHLERRVTEQDAYHSNLFCSTFVKTRGAEVRPKGRFLNW